MDFVDRDEKAYMQSIVNEGIQKLSIPTYATTNTDVVQTETSVAPMNNHKLGDWNNMGSSDSNYFNQIAARSFSFNQYQIEPLRLNRLYQ